MYREVNTGTNLPAEIEINAVDGDAYKFLFMAKGGGSANKSYLFQETKALLNPTSLLEFVAQKMDLLGTSACPPYHLAVVIGGTSAEFTLKTAKLASARYLDSLPLEGNDLGRGFRDVELEAAILKVTQESGIGAQFGGKYFCHDVRVVRLPRHGASCPVAIAVSCSADRQALGKITAEGVFLEQLEHDPAQYLPEVTDDHLDDDVVRIDLNRPMDEIRATLSKLPVKTRVSLNGPVIVARDIAHAKLKERIDAGEGLPAVHEGPRRLLRRSGQDPRGHGLGLVRPHHRRAHGLLRRPVPAARRQLRDAGQGQPLPGRHRGLRPPRRLLPRLHRRPRRPPGPGLHHLGRGARVPRARHGGGLEDRGAWTSRPSSWSTTRATTSSKRSPRAVPSPCADLPARAVPSGIARQAPDTKKFAEPVARRAPVVHSGRTQGPPQAGTGGRTPAPEVRPWEHGIVASVATDGSSPLATCVRWSTERSATRPHSSCAKPRTASILTVS